MKTTRTLIIRFSAIGDTVITASAVSALRQKFPNMEIVWAVSEECAPVIAVSELADHIVIADKNEWRNARMSPHTWNAQLRTFFHLRRYKFDYGFDFQGHAKTALCLNASGAKRKFSSRGTDPLSRIFANIVDVESSTEHESIMARRLLEHAFGDLEPVDRPIMPGQDELIDPKLVTITTGAGHPAKVVPISTWNNVAHELAQAGFSVVLLGGKDDESFDSPLVKNLVGKTSLETSMEWVSKSALHLSGDTGTAHIAAAYGVPTVTIFGFMPSIRFRPKSQKGIVIDHQGHTDSVTAEEILEASFEILRSKQFVS